MNTTYYRLHDENRDHEAICDEANWESRRYGNDPTEDVRHGVSACESIEELAQYMATHGIECGRPVLVVYEGDEADEEDHDAADGAVLTWPQRIIGVYGDGTPEWDEFDAALGEVLGW